LNDALASQFALFNRYKTPFTAAIFDIDKFKQINDENGHLYGDQVLQDFAKLMSESVRETDILARYGGEEFIVVMPETDLAGASVFCERLRERIERQLIVTVSGGIAAPTFDDTQESLLARADAALYQAKTAGRNQIFYHDGENIEPVQSEIPVAVG
jgi:diguanylate cyclase (GGDEF)-like protein